MDLASLTALLIALAALVFSYKIYQQARYIRLFGAFDLASQITAANPDVMRKLHNLPTELDDAELSAIATLSVILDGYQHSYGISWNPFETKGRGYDAMQSSMEKKSEYLNKLLARKENQSRWKYIKDIYYGDFDECFVKAVDNLIKFENSKHP